MKGDGLVTLIVLAGLVLVGVIAWRKGLFDRAFGTPIVGGPQLGGYPQPFAGGLGPQEQAGSESGKGSAFQQGCSAVLQGGGTLAMMTPDPRAQVAGLVGKVGGPAICAAHEWAATQVWDGSKWVARGTAGAVKSAANATAGAAKSVYKNTLGRIF